MRVWAGTPSLNTFPTEKCFFFFKEVFKTLRKFLIENFMLTIGLEGEVVSKREMDLWYIVWILPLDGCS